MSSVFTGDKLRGLAAAAALAALFALLLAIPMTRTEAAPADDEPVGSVEPVIDGLVAEALRANLELEASGTTVGERLAALDAARARYLPAHDLTARYSAADGGRTIAFPVGDLLNPVYATLNHVTGSSRFAPVARAGLRVLQGQGGIAVRDRAAGNAGAARAFRGCGTAPPARH